MNYRDTPISVMDFRAVGDGTAHQVDGTYLSANTDGARTNKLMFWPPDRNFVSQFRISDSGSTADEVAFGWRCTRPRSCPKGSATFTSQLGTSSGHDRSR